MKFFGIFDSDGVRVVPVLLEEEDADILVDDLNKHRGGQEFYNQEEEYDGTVSASSFDDAEKSCKRDGLLPE